MIIYGIKSVYLQSKRLREIICPSCHKRNSLILSVFGKHFHIFWIPMFPVGKKGLSQCQHCKNVLELKQMPERVKREYEKLKQNSNARLWQYSGLIILLIFFILPMIIAFVQVMIDKM